MSFGDTIQNEVLGLKPSVPEDTDAAANAVAEGAAVNTTVGITAHSSFANGNGPLDYSLVADSSGGGFKIDQSSGVVTVADPGKIDFESSPGHLYTITVRATKNDNFFSDQTFTISVNDVAPSTPVDANPAANTVLEGAANGTATGITASASDVNGGTVTWSLGGDTSGGGFTINPTTGVITVADGSKIDFESAPGHAYTVTAVASDGTLTSSQTFTINVGDVAMTTPVDTNGAANSVAEGAAAGTTVGITAQASDPSGPAATYSLIGDTSGGGFTINASTGVVTVADPSKIDFESTAPGHSYNIIVQATAGAQTTQQTFTIGVSDVAPSIPVDGNGAANSVAEGAAVGTTVGVTVSSSDVNGGAVTYSLTADSSGGGFAIDPISGVITVINSTKIDYETAAGHAYTVTAQASDGILPSLQTFSIPVTNVAPSTPVDNNGAANTVAEGAAAGTAVGITASSTDVNGPAVTYSLTGDSSGGGFAINSSTGVITVADSSKIDFESAAGHAYSVTATASDGALTSSQTFSIGVTDVAPSAPADTDNATNSIDEGATNGSTVGITASSTDPNGPAASYTLTDDAGGRFTIDSSTGVVTVANGAAIDFETAPGNAYSITVQGTSGALSSTQTFSIAVTDVGPSTPADTNGAANSVDEGAANGTPVGITASSADPGGGPAATYTLTDDAGGRFTIDPTTGVVTVADGSLLDFETDQSHDITVQATAGALTNSITFTIAVNDVNDNAPVFTSSATPSVAENTTAVVALTTTDVDTVGTNPANFSITGGADQGLFTITGGNQLQFIAPRDFETQAHSYAVQVTANDGVNNTVQNLTVALTDANDNAPVFTSSATPNVAENTTAVVALTTTDADTVGTNPANFSITGGADAGLFTITGGNQLEFIAARDFETQAHSYAVQVTANDGVNNTVQNLTVTLTDTNDNAPVFTSGTTGSEAENTAASNVVYDANATDADGTAANNTITFSLTPGGDNDFFNINSTTGEVTFKVAPDFEAPGDAGGNNVYDVVLHANDGVHDVTRNVAISVTDLNDNAPIFTSGTTATTPENVSTSTAVYTALAPDADGTAANNTVAYSLAAGVNDNDLFNINPATGAVTFKASPDFESPTDAGGNNVYDIVVTASDGVPAHDATRAVAITVTDANDNAPVFTSGSTGSESENTAASNVVYDANATDADPTPANNTIAFSLSAGGDNDFFNINSSTGEVTFKVSPDFEAPGDAGANNVYDIVVHANDGVHDVTKNVPIFVTDLNDNAPVFTSGGTASTPENVSTSTAVYTAVAPDADGTAPNNTVTYSLTAGVNDNDRFNINSTTGAVTFKVSPDFESPTDAGGNNVYDIVVTASDGLVAHNATKAVAITVTDVNDNAPIFASGTTASTAENVSTATAVYTALAPDADGTAANNTVSYSLAAGVNDNDLFNVNSSTGAVTFKTSPDFETPADAGGNNVYDIVVTASDGLAAHDTTRAVAITVTDLNDNSPIFQSGTTGSEFENSPTSTVAYDANATDADGTAANNTITYSLSAGGDNDFFNINATTGEVTFKVSPNFENPQDAGTNNFYDVVVHANDGAHDVTQNVAIEVKDNNDAPTLSATPTNPVYTPGVDLFNSVTASTIEAGQSIDQLVFTVSNVNDLDETMSIDGSPVALVNGTLVTPTTGNAMDVSVSVVGTTATVTISKTGGVAASVMAGIVDGMTYTDPTVAGVTTRAVTITSLHDTGGNANGGNPTGTPNITSTINFDQAPTITAGGTLNYTEDDGARVIDNTIVVNDNDNPTLQGATVKITGGFVSGEDVLSFVNTATITGNFVGDTLTLTGSDTLANYQTALRSVKYTDGSQDPSGADRTISWTVNDGSLDSTVANSTIHVTPVNDAPVTAAGGTLNYTENQAATVIDAGVTVSDVDNANMASATVQIGAGFASGQDVLDADVTGTSIGKSYNAATGLLTLTGSDTKAHYQQVLDSVTYFNSSDNPSGADRTVSYTVNDGALNSNSSTATVHVTAVNDAPVTTAGGTLNYTENQAASVIDASVTVTDVDNANMASATVQIGAGFASGQDVLDANVVGTSIGKSYNAATGLLTLTGSDTKAHYQQVLDSVTYFNSSDNPSGADRTVSYTVNDGAANSNTSTATVHVTPVNDAPVVTATGTLAYTENDLATAIAPALTVTDADTGTLTTATVTISANYVTGEDVLAFANTANITGSFDAPSGTLTLTGTDTVANYQAALRTVTYVDTSENPSTAPRTVTFKADDGQAANHLSAGSNHTITVASVDDAPTVTVPGAQDPVSAHTDYAITGISTADVDAGAGPIKTSLATTHGNVTVTLSGAATLVDATVNGSHSLHIQGTPTDVNATLASIIYHGDAGFTGADALTVQTNDLGHTGTGGPLSSSVGTVNIGVIPKVWFIDNSATGAQDGSQAHPFQSIAAFNAINDGGAGHAQTGDYIYLKTGTGTYSETDGIHLLNNQQLVGAGDGLSFTDPLNNANTLVIETAGTRPVIDVTGGAGNDAIHLAQGNTIHGFNIATDNAAAIGIVDNGGTVGTLNISNMDVGVDPDGGAVSGNLGQAISITHGGTGGSMTFGTVNSAGGTDGITLGGALATNFSAAGGTLSGHSGSEINITGGSGTVSYGGTIGDGTGLSASITGRSAGAVTLSGNINDSNDTGGGIAASGNTGGTIDFTGGTKTLDTGTSNAVSLSSNSGATINFTGGGLNIHTTGGTAVSDSVAGTLSVTGSGNTINTTSGTALNLAFITVGAGGVTFDSATTTSAATGISINTVGQAAGSTGIDINGGSIAGATANGVIISGTSADVSIASSIASTAAGHSVQVTGSGSTAAGGNTIAFSGGITDPGLGINLDNNDQNTNGATINFTGALNIDSTTHTGFNAINGGTVNANNAANSSVTTTGTALNVANTTIGASGLVFHDISSTGAASGIILNNTGSGSLTVTGDGGAANNHSGGQIVSSTGSGVSLTTTGPVSLNYLDITNSGADGINASGVNGFTNTRSVISDNGGGATDEGMQLTNISGTVSIDHTNITNAPHNGIFLHNTNTNLTSFSYTNGTITDTVAQALGNDGILLETSGTSVLGSGTISGSTFSNMRATGVGIFSDDTSRIGFASGGLIGGTSGTADDAANSLTVQSNTFSSNNIGVDFEESQTSNMVFRLLNNTITGNHSHGINVFSTAGADTGPTSHYMVGQIDTNTVGTQGVLDSGSAIGNGLRVAAQGNATHWFLTVNNNTFHEVPNQDVMSFIGQNGAGTTGTETMNFKITNNTVTAATGTNQFGGTVQGGMGIFVLADEAAPVKTVITGNNISTTNPAGEFDIYLAERTGPPPGATLSVEGTGTVSSFIIANNTLNDANKFFDEEGNATLAAPGSGVYPLLAAAGGVQASSPTPGETSLTQAELDSVVAAAIAQWASAGASPAQLAALNAVTFSVADLSGSTVGEQAPGHIVIDSDAAGHGWFVDPTPNDNSEFTHAQNAAGTDLLTDPSNAAAGHLDLLTTVMHELGHELGLGDVTSPADDLMYINLVDGERRLPDAADVAQASAQAAEAAVPLTAQAAPGTPIVAGTAGNDTIDAGHGGNILFGGAGADTFVFGSDTPLDAPTPAQLTHLADYHTAEGDTFDFSALTSAFHNSSVNDALVVRAVEDASGTFATLQVDHIDPAGMPAAPNWVNVAQLDGAHAGDAVNVLIDNHSVHLAQIHVDLLV